MTESNKSRPIPNQRLHRERERRCWSQQELADKVGTTPLNVGRWERGVTQPGPYYRQKLCEIFEMTPQQLGFMRESADTSASNEPATPLNEPVIPLKEPSSSLWNVPYRRNLFFTGREDILTHLHATLISEQQPIALAQPHAISGLGGIGKTQAAIEYAYRYRDSYNTVLWVRADSHDLLISDFLTIAALLNLPERNEQDQSKVVRAVIRWFDTHDRWLLILDNADHPDILDEFIPSAGKGHVLLTTRAQALGTVAQRIELDTLGLAEGTLFLLRRTKRIKGNAGIESVSATVREQAQAIVEAVDGLPLALDQAGAYIEETGCSLVDYLKFYKTRRNRLLRTRGRDASGHPEPVATTWSLSFEKIEQANPAAAELLRLCAFLHPDAIPESMLVEGASELGSVLQALVEDELELNEAIGELRKYSLVKRDFEMKTLNMHRLVQAVIKDGMGKEEQREWAERTIRMVNRAFPDFFDKVETWPRCQQYLPHVLICTELIAQWDLIFPETTLLLNQVGDYLHQRGQYTEAELLLQTALTIREHVLGRNHPETAGSIHSLASLYATQGKYKQAEDLYKQVIAIRERVLESEHPDVAESLDGLGLLYREQNRYAEALALCEQALDIRMKLLGPDHLDVGQSLNNVALLYFDQGHYIQAEPLYLQSWEIFKKILGPNHPEVATSLNNLGWLYLNQGKYDLVEPYHLQALTIREQVLGPNHPHVAMSLNALAVLYERQGKYALADSYYLRALALREQALGPEHLDVNQSLYNLGLLYSLRKKYVQAEQFLQRSLSLCGRLLEADNPLVADTLHALGVLYRDQGKLSEAEPFLQRALVIRKQASSDMYIAQSLNAIAILYHLQGKYDEAEQLFQEALFLREKIYGEDHPHVAYSLISLAKLYLDQGRYTEAEPLFQRTLTIREQVLGLVHPDVAITLENYSSLLYMTGRESEAAKLETRAQAIRAELQETSPTP